MSHVPTARHRGYLQAAGTPRECHRGQPLGCEHQRMARIRPAAASDARAIAAVHVASWRSAYAGLVPAATLDGLNVDARARQWARWLTDPKASSVVLVVTEPQVCGFCAVGPARDPEPAVPELVEVYSFYLHPQHWGRGLGRAARHRLAHDRQKWDMNRTGAAHVPFLMIFAVEVRVGAGATDQTS